MHSQVTSHGSVCEGGICARVLLLHHMLYVMGIELELIEQSLSLKSSFLNGNLAGTP